VEILTMLRAAVGAILITLFAALPALPESGEGLEYQVKAAFLFNFLKFVEWPPVSGDAPWVIGVLGRNPFGEKLNQTVRGKVVNGRAVEVRQYARLSDVKDCNILFISRAEFEKVGAIVQPGLLTVGESSAFLKSGGAINFYLDDHRVHIEIRLEIARAVGLHVSAQLLKLGRVL
jgi:hypothetical protein